MGICYELYNHTQKEFTKIGYEYAVETKFWVNSPLSNFLVYATRYYWYHSDDVKLIADTEDAYFDLKQTYKDVTNEIVKEYNEHADSNERDYKDGTIPKILTNNEIPKYRNVE